METTLIKLIFKRKKKVAYFLMFTTALLSPTVLSERFLPPASRLGRDVLESWVLIPSSPLELSTLDGTEYVLHAPLLR